MQIDGVTWLFEEPPDSLLMKAVPNALRRILNRVNGFILHDGLLHVRGACELPDWHSLNKALDGPSAFHSLYESVEPNDIPFAQDQLGDQFLLRSEQIFRLSAESGEVELLAESLDEFFDRVNNDPEEYLNVSLDHSLMPGELLLAYPPFVVREAGAGVSLKAIPANQVILFHADLARQIKNLPDGASIEITLPGDDPVE